MQAKCRTRAQQDPAQISGSWKFDSLVCKVDVDLYPALQVGHDIDKGGAARIGIERASLQEQSFGIE